MKCSYRAKIGRTFVIVGLLTLPFAYSNFLPTALSSYALPDYVKNHFIREVMFGVTLVVWTISLAIRPLNISNLKKIALLGSAVVLPFWIARAFGWSVGGMEAVWGEAIKPSGAYALHIPQALFFYVGLALLWFELRTIEKNND
ncbi:MAG: hypothetical protein ABJN65_01030 [Parasphingorhabdus sp.]